MVGNVSSAGVTIKRPIVRKLKTHKPKIMKTRGQKRCSISGLTDKSGPSPLARNQAGIKKFAAGTKSYPEHPSGFQNRVENNLGSLDSPSPDKMLKTK